MKNVIKMFVAIAVVGVMSVSAFAQGAGPGGAKGGGKQGGPGGPGGQQGGRRGGMMNLDAEVLAKLNLTGDQKNKVKALKDSTQKKMQELFKSAGGGPGGAKGGGKPGGPGGPGAGMREKVKPIMDGYQAGMKGILTPSQFKDYEKGVKEARAKMRAQFGGGKPGGPEGGKAGKGGKGKGTPPPSA